MNWQLLNAPSMLSGQPGPIQLVNPDGSTITLPISGSAPSWDWSWDGSIVFVMPDGRIGYYFPLSNGQWQTIVVSNAVGTLPAIAPNEGLQIFAAPPSVPNSLNSSIWAVEANNFTLPEEIVPGGAAPSLAPSGSWLTCTMKTNEGLQIFRANTDGSNLMQLTFPGDPRMANGNASSISPNEMAIAHFAGDESLGPGETTSGWRNVALMTPVGSNRHLVTNYGPGEIADDPCWFPDMSGIAYNHALNGVMSLRAINPDGTNDRFLLPFIRSNSTNPLRLLP